jgi:hypothetical protein
MLTKIHLVGPRGGLSVNTVGETGRLGRPSCHPGTPIPGARSVAGYATLHDHSILVDSLRGLPVPGGNAAGGAVAIVAAEFIGGGTARDEGAGRPTSWQGRVTSVDFVVNGMFRQIGVNAGNTATAEYEGKSMHEDKPTRILRGGQYQGRAADTASVCGLSVSSVGWASVHPSGEPALGVMGGLLQPVSSPAEPPVSSLSGLPTGSSTTAPAPFADFRPRDVSPTANAARVAVEVAPGRPSGRAGSLSGQGRKSCPPV